MDDTSVDLVIGSEAPDFTLAGVDPRTGEFRDFSLSEYRGHPVVLVFYPADNSPVCTRQLTEYTASVADVRDAGCAGAGHQPPGPRHPPRVLAGPGWLRFPVAGRRRSRGGPPVRGARPVGPVPTMHVRGRPRRADRLHPSLPGPGAGVPSGRGVARRVGAGRRTERVGDSASERDGLAARGSTSSWDVIATIEPVFVLGIDPGLSRCGYCVLEVDDRRGTEQRSGGRARRAAHRP